MRLALPPWLQCTGFSPCERRSRGQQTELECTEPSLSFCRHPTVHNCEPSRQAAHLCGLSPGARALCPRQSHRSTQCSLVNSCWERCIVQSGELSEVDLQLTCCEPCCSVADPSQLQACTCLTSKCSSSPAARDLVPMRPSLKKATANCANACVFQSCPLPLHQ